MSPLPSTTCLQTRAILANSIGFSSLKPHSPAVRFLVKPLLLQGQRRRRHCVAMANVSQESLREAAGAVPPRRDQMLATTSYSPPPWAAGLSPIPKEIFTLAHLPTPIHKWGVPGLPAGVELYIKRDDVTGMQLSGNKVRKLEFLIADARAKGCDCVITIGGIQSNHCRATAVAARYAGLDTYLILRTARTVVDSDAGLVGNLLVERMVGAHINLVTKEEYQVVGSVALGKMLEEKLKAQGRKPYIIPVGGSDAMGSWGYVEAVRELETQLQSGATGGATGFDDIVMACGSGGTTAGLSLACHLSSLNARVLAYGVCDDPNYFYEFTQGILDVMGANVSSRDICTIRNAKGSGYAISTAEELEFVSQVAKATGVILDPVYSGKALYGMLKDITGQPAEWEGRRILYIHTGGLLGMYDKVPQLQKLMEPSVRFAVPSELVQTKGASLGMMF